MRDLIGSQAEFGVGSAERRLIARRLNSPGPFFFTDQAIRDCQAGEQETVQDRLYDFEFGALRVSEDQVGG